MPATDPDDVSATCTAAADLIESDGWIQGNFWRHPKTNSVIDEYVPGALMCALGAIRAACGLIREEDSILHNASGAGAWEECRATIAVETEVIARLGFLGPASISHWNDLSGRTADEVVGLLRDVAAKHQPDEYRSTPEVTS